VSCLSADYESEPSIKHPRLEVILEGEGGMTPRLIGVNGTRLRYTTADGNLVSLLGTVDGEGSPVKKIGVMGTKLRYIDDNGDRRYLIGDVV